MDKGVLIFYDWESAFENVDPIDAQQLILSMLRYKKYGTPPPEFTGLAKMAASFIFPQLDRELQSIESGKKGGRPKKRVSGVSANINKEEICESSETSEPKLAYGLFNNVFLTKEEFALLEKQFALTLNRRINLLSKDLNSGLVCKDSHYATILSSYS